MKETRKFRNYVHNHRTAITVGTIATLTGIIVLQQSGIQSLNKFLAEKDLLEEYYHDSED